MRGLTVLTLGVGVALTVGAYGQAVSPAPSTSPLQVLLVGGGPEPNLNQAAIESNIRYLSHLMPSNANVTTLFANGSLTTPTVLARAAVTQNDAANMLYSTIQDHVLMEPSDSFRKPQLPGGVSGAATSSVFRAKLQALGDNYRAGTAAGPLLLYFTGHGGPTNREYSNNIYAMWRPSPPLSVTDFATDLRVIPRNVPVYVVMVQCFSGGFANLIFKGGEEGAPVTDRPLAGFFASTSSTEAAGCTAAIDEKYYPDFTSFFFSALTGRNRVGQKVTGADFRHDGKITMAEAYDYTIANDPTIDIPTCTSDMFLRRFVPDRDSDVFMLPRILVKSWATPGQLAALNILERKIGFHGKHPVTALYNMMTTLKSPTMPVIGVRKTVKRFDGLASNEFQMLRHRFPGLTSKNDARRRSATARAVAWIEKNYHDSALQAVLRASHEGDNLQETAAEQFALRVRYLRLFKSIFLAHKLMQTGEPDVQARFAELMKAEDSTPLPPAAGWAEPQTATLTR